MSTVAENYKKNIVPKLVEQFNYKTPMQVPRLEKIVINSGMGEAVQNSKVIQYAEYAIGAITGQKPVVTRAKKAIASFKLRAGMPIGVSVTLRGPKMYSFLERFISVALPRVRDFRGIPKKGFDGKGNYTMGLKEQVVFPEVEIEKLDKVRGMNITFVTTAGSDEEGRALLTHLGLPFRK